MKILEEGFMIRSLAPREGIISMDFDNLDTCKEWASKLGLTYWSVVGVVQEQRKTSAKTVYEEKDGVEIINLFKDLADSN